VGPWAPCEAVNGLLMRSATIRRDQGFSKLEVPVEHLRVDEGPWPESNRSSARADHQYLPVLRPRHAGYRVNVADPGLGPVRNAVGKLMERDHSCRAAPSKPIGIVSPGHALDAHRPADSHRRK